MPNVFYGWQCNRPQRKHGCQAVSFVLKSTSKTRKTDLNFNWSKIFLFWLTIWIGVKSPKSMCCANLGDPDLIKSYWFKRGRGMAKFGQICRRFFPLYFRVKLRQILTGLETYCLEFRLFVGAAYFKLSFSTCNRRQDSPKYVNWP